MEAIHGAAHRMEDGTLDEVRLTGVGVGGRVSLLGDPGSPSLYMGMYRRFVNGPRDPHIDRNRPDSSR